MRSPTHIDTNGPELNRVQTTNVSITQTWPSSPVPQEKTFLWNGPWLTRPSQGRRLTLTPCQGVERSRYVQHRGVRPARARVGPHAPALRRDRPAPAGQRRRGQRIPLLPGRPARRTEPHHRAEGPRLHPPAGAGHLGRAGERGG